MFRLRVSTAIPVLLAAAASGATIAVGCSATTERRVFGDSPSSGTSNSGGGGGAGGRGGAGGAGASGAGDPGFGGNLVDPDAGTGGESPDANINPCGTECGPVELCDPNHLGLDDDCDGQVDESCACIAGQAHACFKGDPSYRTAEGCFPGTQICTETGSWGPCAGGVHATEECFLNSTVGCHPIQAAPFADVNLKDGTGSFSANAQPGTETWTVACPSGVEPCPSVSGMNPTDDFKPLQSGEYTVTYTKGLADGSTESCTYPLFVGAPGLRVEMEWEHEPDSVDLDLYLHKPNNTQPWEVGGSPVVCGYGNCQLSSFEFPVSWFSDTATPPDPVNWWLDPVDANNTCFFAPRGVGQEWRNNGQGCHNPRLDLDNIFCDYTVTDVNDSSFCAPENINIDFPPKGQWMRVAVHYFSGGVSFDVHPRIKIFCNGALGADLGPTGFYEPERAVAFPPGGGGSTFWLVADVIFPDGGECGNEMCVVRPIYQDEALKVPLLTTSGAAATNFGPGYPTLP